MFQFDEHAAGRRRVDECYQRSFGAGTRLFVEKKVHDDFVGTLAEAAKSMKQGSGLEADTRIGPLVSKEQLDRVTGYLDVGKKEGAKAVIGGERNTEKGLEKGYYVKPTIFTGVRNDMRIAQEEIFGPVLAVIPFEDEQDAIRIGNDIRFGLAAAVWTRDLRRAMLVTDKLKAGTIWVNNYRATSFTSPFGGYKDSGIGRESGIDAIREYVETKCVWISTDLDVPNPFIRR